MGAPSETARRLIAGLYAVDPARPIGGAGQPAFAVADRLGAALPLMAVRVAPTRPPRAAALQALAGITEGLLGPIAHGVGPAADQPEAYYVICPVPSGPPVGAAPRAWSESELLDCLLRPAAQVLARLAARGMTHRGIRSDNVFQPAPGQPVVLGQAWAAPPASLQPAGFEPPYSAMCLPCARGEGTIADDVYALGVLMVLLALGRLPPEESAEETVARKLELGSFAAIAGDSRLPSAIADLARGMLAEEPEHRPSPALLLDPATARGRRVAARPPKRAPIPAQIGARLVRDSRTLAHAIAVQPEQGLAALRNGTVDAWLRRGLGDAVLAARLDEAIRARPGEAPGSEARIAMRAIAILDPLAPLCWRGAALWPNGLGPALAATENAALVEMVASEAATEWAAVRPERLDVAATAAEARRRRAMLGAHAQDGIRRLAYALNPLLACASPLLAGRCVMRPEELPQALEASGAASGVGMVDSDVAAFIAARLPGSGEAAAAKRALAGGAPSALARLELFAALQERAPAPAPTLARRLLASTEALLADWHGTARRSTMAARLTALAEAGLFAPMLALVQDPTGRAADLAQAREAARALERIERELELIDRGGEARSLAARALGREAASGVALGVLALAVAMAALG